MCTDLFKHQKHIFAGWHETYFCRLAYSVHSLKLLRNFLFCLVSRQLECKVCAVVLTCAVWPLATLPVMVQAQCSVRDCKVGPGFKLAEGSECRDEVLANVKLPQ